MYACACVRACRDDSSMARSSSSGAHCGAGIVTESGAVSAPVPTLPEAEAEAETEAEAVVVAVAVVY